MENETNVNVGAAAETAETTTEKTYTQAEVEALLQSETDRRVSSALKKQERKNEEKVREAQKLAEMNATERYQYELEQREKAIVEKEAALALAENRAEASKILAEKGLSVDLIALVVAEDAVTMSDNINLLEKAFRQSVKAEVEKRIGGSNGKRQEADTDALTKESFRKMSIIEQQQILNNNPELQAMLMG